MTNFTFGIGGQVTGTQDRTFTGSIPLDLAVIAHSTKNKDGWLSSPGKSNHPIFCGGEGKDGLEIKGNLGLAEIINDGLLLINTPSDFNVYQGNPTAEQANGQSPPPPLPNGGGKNPAVVQPLGTGAAKGATASGGSTGSANFGSQVEFMLVLGINGGPNWTLTHYKGPGAGTASLLNFTRTTTNTLNFSSGPTCQTPTLYAPGIPLAAGKPSLVINTSRDGHKMEDVSGTVTPPSRITVTYGNLPSPGTVTIVGKIDGSNMDREVVSIPANSIGSVSTLKNFSIVKQVIPSAAPKNWPPITVTNSTPSLPRDYWESISVCQADQSEITANKINELQNKNYLDLLTRRLNPL
jgi:hypothetical protein